MDSNYQYIFQSKTKKREFFSDHIGKPLLNLIIYNPQNEYEKYMKTCLQRYLQKVPFLTFFFIAFRNQEKEIVVEDDCLYFKGEEGFLPHILNKTVLAIRYCIDQHIPFDYLIRSNISTAIQFSKFPYEELINIDYASSCVYNLQWTDPPFGIHDHRYKGLLFAQGTNIILSKKMVEYVLSHQHELNREIIDDVAIGLLLRYVTNIHPLQQMIIYNDTDVPMDRFVYRHKSIDRWNDAKRMEQLLSQFL